MSGGPLERRPSVARVLPARRAWSVARTSFYEETMNDTVFLCDVDNTLLDNDRVAADLRQHLTEAFGAQRQERYWVFFEELRAELGYADYLGALQRYRVENPRDAHLLEISAFLIDYPFKDRLYPRALD